MNTPQKVCLLVGVALIFVAAMMAMAVPVPWSGHDCGAPLLSNMGEIRAARAEAERAAEPATEPYRPALRELLEEQERVQTALASLWRQAESGCEDALRDRSILTVIVFGLGILVGAGGHSLFRGEELTVEEVEPSDGPSVS